MYIKRIIDLSKILKEKSCFLLGARQLGKSTYISKQLNLSVAKSYNLLENDIFLKLHENPSILRQEIEAEGIKNALVVIDEIQKCPNLLDEIHLLIEKHQIKFLLTGSSARKLKKAGTNLLAGRAINRNFHPFTYIELKNNNFNLSHAMHFGLIPSHYLSKNPTESIEAYVVNYLTTEISTEGLTRNIPAFYRFLQVAATCNTQLINYTNIASDAKVNRTTVHNYFQILIDTLLAYELVAYTKTIKRKAIETSKFYFFDMGIVNHLRKLGKITKESLDYGEFFEHFIFLEIKAYLDYFHPTASLTYWRSTSGFEVDFLINNEIAIEVKSSSNISDKHLKGLRAFQEEKIAEKLILVCDEKTKRLVNEILICPWSIFLEDLWNHKLLQIEY